MKDIRIEPTTHCNYKCSICPHASMRRRFETMSQNLFESIWNKVLDCQYGDWDNGYATLWHGTPTILLTFSGMGEPLMDQNLEDKVLYAKSQNTNILVITNGYLLTIDRFKSLQDAGVDAIRVSFHGASAEEYSRVHGVPEHLYYRVKDQLEQISRMRTKTKFLMVMDAFTDSWKSWVDQWKDKADVLEVWRPHNWTGTFDFRPLQKERRLTCRRPFSGPIQIQVDGKVNMCCFDYNGDLILGDLTTQTLDEVFSSPVFQHLRNCHTTGQFENSGLICEHCDHRNVDKSNVLVYSSNSNQNRVEMLHQPR